MHFAHINYSVETCSVVCIVKGIVFPLVMHRCQSWTIKEPKHQKLGASEPWCWRRLLGLPWKVRRSNQLIVKEINIHWFIGRNIPVNIHWKDWCWSSSPLATWCEGSTHWKRPWCWERLRAGGEGGSRGWDGWKASPTHVHEFEQTPGDSEGQGNLACCGPWGCKESDMT